MKHLNLPGTNLNVSTYCYGVMHMGTHVKGDDAFRLYEKFCDMGGNFFDTAHSYAVWINGGEGASESALGACMKKFGNRADMVVSTKGALHGLPPIYERSADCMTPEVIDADISQSLERLQIDAIDLYTLHRDNTNHEAGEIIETLNAQIKRGRIRYIGASNWTRTRLTAANAYAKEKGLRGFVSSSPQWNLMQPNHAPINWDGSYDDTCVMTSPEDVAWHRETLFPMMPWTPTAYGYIAGIETSNSLSFDNAISRDRRERARKLAAQVGCTPLQVGLAYLRSYEFPVFPIIGTMNLHHLEESLGADDVTITPQQRQWLLEGK